ncbi:hypothetical protein HNP38_003129 [Chryseobacterium defluvii]|uniref:Uncharacterized protein n=1 Tax=Chryseobacterium defluvii TaxID=160396 RepID=A0A840KJX7_9FLAO|nr:hypothetical protein [Chryseobacterium defluvii]MBB4807813.1 hypothetical protein [Chryseobacterium defluvii]
MKKIIQFLLCVFAFSFISAQENYEVSTLRIGPYKMFMEKAAAEKLAGMKLIPNDGESKSTIKYHGETILIDIYERYINESKPNELSVYGLSTKSKKFRTKGGIGVGSTRDEVINAFKNYSSFSSYPGWNDKGEKVKNESRFVLNDDDAGTVLSFKIVDNIVTEVSVYMNEGC